MSEAPDAITGAEATTVAIETGDTATPVIENNTTDQPETPPEPDKTFTQKELDEAISKRLAREQRKWERDAARRSQEQQPQGPKSSEIDPDYDPDAFIEAKARERADELVREREAAREQARVHDAYREREMAAMDKFDDYERVALNRDLPVTDAMWATIQATETGPDILYWLGQNPAEALKISRYPDFVQAKEIGRIEAQIASTPIVVRKPSSAPPPINPVTPNGATPALSTLDPRAAEQMSTSEWIAAERARTARKRG